MWILFVEDPEFPFLVKQACLNPNLKYSFIYVYIYIYGFWHNALRNCVGSGKDSLLCAGPSLQLWAHQSTQRCCLPLSQQRWSGRSSQPSPILREIPGAHPAAIPVLGTSWWAGDAGRAWHISLASALLLWAAAGAATKAKLRGRHHRAALSRAHTSAESRQEPEEQVAHDLLPRLPPAPPALC